MKWFLCLITGALIYSNAYASQKKCDFGVLNFSGKKVITKITPVDQKGCDLFRKVYGADTCAVDYTEFEDEFSPMFGATGVLMSAILAGECNIGERVRCLSPIFHDGLKLNFCGDLLDQVKKLLEAEWAAETEKS